ncbi:GrpB family protein [Halovenus rubra]|uniref:GrpB family protein n=2 Tax=Halovenus rubra TaxID=869890 RepID=A0ABD5X0Y9_9EURY|nr:GrpB family protein [Halovenus rubra]
MVGLERGTVELRAHQDEWHDNYLKEANRLLPVIQEHIISIEHVGSTAIDGIPAKPIIDILIVVDDNETAHNLAPILERHGYEQRPDEDVQDRLFFVKGPRTNRTHYLSVTAQHSTFHTEQIAFREYLRENPAVAEEYAALKVELAEQYPDDRTRYTANKSEFIQRVLDDAVSD